MSNEKQILLEKIDGLITKKRNKLLNSYSKLLIESDKVQRLVNETTIRNLNI